jgi:hypothetical protein
MKVLCIKESKFLIKSEWYNIDQGLNLSGIFGNKSSDIGSFKSITSDADMYRLKNHTDRKWFSSWFHKSNFATIEELRELKLNKILE